MTEISARKKKKRGENHTRWENLNRMTVVSPGWQFCIHLLCHPIVILCFLQKTTQSWHQPSNSIRWYFSRCSHHPIVILPRGVSLLSPGGWVRKPNWAILASSCPGQNREQKKKTRATARPEVSSYWTPLWTRMIDFYHPSPAIVKQIRELVWRIRIGILGNSNLFEPVLWIGLKLWTCEPVWNLFTRHFIQACN